MFDDHTGSPGTGGDGAEVAGWDRLSSSVLTVELRKWFTASATGPADDSDAAHGQHGPVEWVRHGLELVLEDLADAAVADMGTVSDDDLLAVVSTVEAARRRLDAVSVHALAELDARGVTDTQVGLVTGSWLAAEAKLPVGSCKARVKLATKLRVSLPDVDRALAEGLITFDHARVLAEAANPRIVDDVALVTPNLIDAAQRLSFDHWKREITALVALLDADGGHRPGDDPCDNKLRMRRGLDNGIHIDGQLFGDSALIAEHALNAKADELFHRYRADQELTPDLRMPPHSTLLAMALAELLSEALAKDAGSSTPARPEVSLVVNAADPDTVTTSDGTRIGDTERHTLLCDPVFRAVVLSVHGLVVDMGRDQRLVTRAQRRALNHRDGGCVFPNCDRPATWTDAHHIWNWQHNGPTKVPLLASLCRYHHGVTHRTGWTMYATTDQWFWWTTPTGDTFWSQRHQHQRAGPTPHPDTSTGPTGHGPSWPACDHDTGPPDTT